MSKIKTIVELDDEVYEIVKMVATSKKESIKNLINTILTDYINKLDNVKEMKKTIANLHKLQEV